jgi:acid phosphatase
MARRAFLSLITLVALVLVPAGASQAGSTGRLDRINHLVVIYEENHSFDNLYGSWERVNGLSRADAAHTTQTDQNGTPYDCLLQDDVNLTVPPLQGACTNATPAFVSQFSNAPFTIDTYIKPTDNTCPPTLQAFSFPNGVMNGNPVGLPGGCTRDIVHRFYQEQFQLDGGRQDHYATGSDAAGLVMGVYDTRALPIYRYLHSGGHPHYAIMDNFFQAAFGGSFLNHQWLIAAASPVCDAANGCPAGAAHSVLDANGFPQLRYPPSTQSAVALYTSPASGGLVDGPLTQACGLSTTVAGLACGDYGVNTMQPAFQPSGSFGAKLPAQTNPTIGDELSAAGVSWAWYSGGWSNADGDIGAPGWTNGTAKNTSTPTGCWDPNVDPNVANWPECPDNLFQYHHQPFNYFANFSTLTLDGMANRTAHLKDEREFFDQARASTGSCDLPAVSFVKPIGQENEHPGYASESHGSDHLVGLLKAVENSACAKDTMVVVTYDEFGGQWDHVPPPGQGSPCAPGTCDQWGPGTRIPTLVISPFLKGQFSVDGTEHDTTSILATIEHRWDLPALATRDAAVADLSSVFDAH